MAIKAELVPPIPEGDAVISDCGKYRYRLGRTITQHQGGLFQDHGVDNLGTVLFIMHNPSTADARQDDPTIGRCQSFARGWGYGRLEVVNLFAFRATNPVELMVARKPITGVQRDVIGPDNDQHIHRAVGDADLVVCAWGNMNTSWKQARAREVRAMVKVPHALAFTQSGDPRHPLYVRKYTQPAPWEPIGGPR